MQARSGRAGAAEAEEAAYVGGGGTAAEEEEELLQCCWAASEPVQPTPVLLSAEEGARVSHESLSVYHASVYQLSAPGILRRFTLAVAAALVAVILLSQPGEEPVAVCSPDTSPLVRLVL